MTRRKFSTTDLTQLQRQLDGWRRRQPGRPRLPEALWKSAAAVAQSEGLSQVPRTLRLDYYKLNQWVAQAKAAGRDASPRAGFVELTLSSPSGSAGNQDYRTELGEGSSDARNPSLRPTGSDLS